MKKIYSILLLLFFICWNKSNAQYKFPTEAEIQASVDKGIDPFFVESTDTFSTRGPFSIVRHLLQDKKGNFWLAAWQGIIKYDGKVFTNYTLKDNLIHFHVFSSFEDSKGNLWFGTVRGGVYRYEPEKNAAGEKSFTLFTKKDGLGNNSVHLMTEDKAGNIWFATGGGATCYDGKTFVNFSTKDGLCSNEIQAIICDKTGKLWVGGEDGISTYDGKTFTTFNYNDGLPFKRVASLLEDKDGNIWIGSSTGFFVYNLEAGLGSGGKTFSEQLRPHFVMYMCKDKKGNVWTAFNQQNIKGDYEGFALYRYDPSTVFTSGSKSFVRVKPKTDSNNPAIFGMICDKDGKIWFGTAKGICRFDPLKADHPCVQCTCKHEGTPSQIMREHEDELEKSFTYFR